MLIEYLDRLAAMPAIQQIRQVARAAMHIGDGDRLLDAGCGLGEEARELARLAGATGKVTAIDLAQALIAEARQRDNGAGVRYAVGDITALDFPDGTFDAVRSERVIQHVPDPDAAIAELARVTIPGGRVCVIDTDWESFLVEGMPTGYIDSFVQLARDGSGLFGPTGRQLRGRFVRAGLTAVAAEPVAIPITGQQNAELVAPLFQRQAFERLLKAPESFATAWFSALDDALARDEFLSVLTIWVVTGTKLGCAHAR
jgi:SAM-dependent methyltransferase